MARTGSEDAESRRDGEYDEKDAADNQDAALRKELREVLATDDGGAGGDKVAGDGSEADVVDDDEALAAAVVVEVLDPTVRDKVTHQASAA